MNLSYSTDIVIFGGGIAGLWLLKRLRLEGYQAILLESSQLGGGQTLASQGIIHGGLKYALGGHLNDAANTIAEMPARWCRCLQGEDIMALRSVTVLSEHYYMWSASGFRSRLKTFLGSRTLQGRVSGLSKQNFPEFFRGASGTGNLYELPDFVVDSKSLIRELIKGCEDFLIQATPDQVEFLDDGENQITGVRLKSSAGDIIIDCQRVVFSAGEGNADLISRCGISSIGTQFRPLHMVYVKQADLPPIYVHCIGDDFSLTPMLTVTSHQDDDGATVWYLGGELAESGVGKSTDDQIAAARLLLDQYFPWVSLNSAQWDSFMINRVEAQMADGKRPDDAVFAEERQAIVVFPTKFTLTPSLADRLVNHLAEQSLVKSASASCDGLKDHLPSPPLGSAVWERSVTP